MKFMEQFESQDGIAFLLIYFKNREKYMYLRFQKLLEFWKRMEQGGRKSFTIGEMEPEFEISTYSGTFLHYLEPLQRDLQER